MMSMETLFLGVSFVFSVACFFYTKFLEEKNIQEAKKQQAKFFQLKKEAGEAFKKLEDQRRLEKERELRFLAKEIAREIIKNLKGDI